MVAMARNDIGRTALHVAAIYGHAESVQYLLALNADPLEEDHFEKSAFDEAGDFEDCVKPSPRNSPKNSAIKGGRQACTAPFG